MTKSQLLGLAVALVPFAAVAQGVPAPVVSDVVRSSSSAVADGIRSNQELIDKEQRDKAAAAPPTSQASQPSQPVPPPQTTLTPAPR